MNKRMLNEVKRNRELMGINESELDEQGFIQGVKKGIEKGKEAIKSVVDKNDNEGEIEKYNNEPISDIIQDIKDMNKSRGKIDVNGETLYFGIGESLSREAAKGMAETDARIAMKEDTGEEVQSGVAPVIDKLFQLDNSNYVSYILIKQF